MARIHGRAGTMYVGIASGGVAEPVAFLTKWSLSNSVDNADVTAFGDVNKVYVAGLPDASGSYAGWYDDATAQLYTASADGVARKFYLYASRANPTQYFFGTGLFDFSVETGVDGGVAISGDFQAASSVLKVG